MAVLERERAASAPKLRLLPASRRQPIDLDPVAVAWQHALDAAQRALDSSARALPADERRVRRTALADERRTTATLLARVAHDAHATEMPWLWPAPLRPELLGLDARVAACVFDLEGVLTDGGRAHAAAWAEVLDAFLLTFGRPVVPFDGDADYRAYLDGRPRLEGIHLFLASRGVRVPEGRPDDDARAATAYGLGRAKGEALRRVLERRGVTALAGARRYLEALARAGLPTAVVSGSQSTDLVLARANLAPLVPVTIDAAAIRSQSLRSRPAADVLLAACRALGVEPPSAVTFTHSVDGIVAGRAAGLGVVGVGDPATLERLRAFGADRTVPSLDALLDPRLRQRVPVG